MGLKEAILKHRGVDETRTTHPDLLVFLREVATDVVQQKLAEIEATVRAEVDARLRAVLEEYVEKIKGEPGDDAQEVDVEAVATRAAALVDHAAIAQKVRATIEVPHIDVDELVRNAAALVPTVDEEALEARIVGKIPAHAPELDAKEIVEKIHSIKEPAIKMGAIKGLDVFLRNLQKSMRDQGSGKMNHGGGMKLKAGAGQTLTRNSDGTWSFTTGGGFSTLAATETPNGTLAVFTFAAATAQPSFVVSDNVIMKATTKAGTVNWTWNSGTKKATLTVPPQDEIYAIV